MSTKKALIAGAVLLLLIVTGLAVMYRSEDRVPAESELSRYPQFAPFLIGKTSFRGIQFNVDTNFYSFAFTTAANSAESFFDEVSKALNGSEWKNTESGDLRRVYVRAATPAAGANAVERVTLSFNPANREVTFVREVASGVKAN
jgi:hypothetical protein